MPVLFDRKVLYEIRVASREYPAQARAIGAEKALTAALEKPSGPVRADEKGDLYVVYAGKVPLIQLFPEDAAAHGHSSLAFHADDVAVRFERLIEAETRRKAIAHMVFSISLTVLMSLIALLLLRRTGEFGDRMHQWLEKNGEKLPSLQVQSMELLGPAAVRSGALLGVEVGKWLLRLLIIYFWALVSLSQFAATRGFVAGMTTTFVRPLPEILTRTAGSLPLLGVMILGTAAVVVLVRFVQLFFAGVAKRETEVPWLRAELAEPVSFLLRLGIILSALLFAAPIVTGSTEGVLPRAGLIALFALGLAATPALASLLVGVGTVFGQKLEPSDLVVFGGRRGRIVGVGLFYVVLQDASGAEIRVPQLMSLFHPTEFLAQRSRVRIEIPLKKLSAEALDALRRAAKSVGTEAEVKVLGADSDGALVALSVTSSEDDTSTRLFLAATSELEAAGLELGRTPRSRRPL
jgi:small-conductance mechanosensitive channel